VCIDDQRTTGDVMANHPHEIDVDAELRESGIYRLTDLSPAADVAAVITTIAVRACQTHDIARRQMKAGAKRALADAGVIGGSSVLHGAFVVAEKNAKRARRAPTSLGDAWESQLTGGDRGVAASVANLVLILTHHADWIGVLAFDARSGQIVFRSRPPFGVDDEPASASYPREIRDVDMVRTAHWFGRSSYEIALSPRADVLAGAVDMIAEQRSYDPVCEYLEPLTWDGTPRLDGMLIGYFGAAVGDEVDAGARYLAAVGSAWMISAVARAYSPGAKADHVLTLVGEQGCGKSTALRVLAGDQWFADSLPDVGGKDAADYVRGPWIVELAELAALRRAEAETVKAFVTRTHDRFRAAYGRHTQSHARRCVFAASTNAAEFLRDTTGNRRWWTVTVGRIDTDAIGRDRDQLWAEAVHRYRAGEAWHITDREVIDAAQEAQTERMARDPWEPVIEAWIAGRHRVSVPEILKDAIGLPTERHDQTSQNRVVHVLAARGWKKGRAREGRSLRWIYKQPAQP